MSSPSARRWSGPWSRSRPPGDLAGPTDLFIRPGHQFAAVDRLLTNFHLPRTTLLALVAAFVGDRWRDLYAAALADGYRFLSFGDAMLIGRWPNR